MEAMLPLLLKLITWTLSLGGGAAVLENKLELYLMDHLPAWARGLVTPAIAAVGAYLAHTNLGISLPEAGAWGVFFNGLVELFHNMPATTSRDLPPIPES